MPSVSRDQQMFDRREHCIRVGVSTRFTPGPRKDPTIPRNSQRRLKHRCEDCETWVEPQSRRCKACADKARIKTGKRTWKSGYVYESSSRYPAHIQIAEKALGRKLGPKEHVHHINMNKQDNRPSNLLVCDPKYHKWLHNEYARRYAARWA